MGATVGKWTPGPWSVEERETASGEPWITVLRGAFDVSHNRAATPGVVADARYSAMSAEENRANAHLMAAAPDLFEALSTLAYRCESLGWPKSETDQARAALAKARGRAAPVKCSVCGRRKKPIGRDGMDTGLCDQDCHGYMEDPRPGYLWPGEGEATT